MNTVSVSAVLDSGAAATGAAVTSPAVAETCEETKQDETEPSFESLVEIYSAPRYSAINWGHFRRRRFEGDYADVGREIQIEDFLI